MKLENMAGGGGGWDDSQLFGNHALNEEVIKSQWKKTELREH